MAACLLLPAMARAQARPMVDIRLPEAAGVGKPFLAVVESWYPLENVRLRFNGAEVRPMVSQEGGKSVAPVLLGIGLFGEPGVYPVEVAASIWGHERTFIADMTIRKSTWGRETLRVAPKMAVPPPEALARIKREREVFRAAVSRVSATRHWTLPFIRPAKGKMLSRFGLHRVFNGKTKSRHTGLDFRAWLGTPLFAIAKGRVVLTGSFYYAGNSVLIDHGNGLFSLTAHLSEFLVKEGDMVEAGQTVGLSGATGRVTGAHLHLGVFVQGQVVDPELFFDGELESNFNGKSVKSDNNELVKIIE
ncbi:MAG: M23 family metallopeptidase [Desulfovibrionaceae bacterium]|nr:M23 family metallopeptidase [Desulfovibrionaceae bacterium]